MSTKGNLTREQAAAIVGEEYVAAVDALNCEPTSRLQCDGDTRVEFAAAVRCKDKDGVSCTLTAYYYQDSDAINSAGDDLSILDWVIEGYEVA